LTATITPASALSPNTSYYLFVGYGASYYDVAGNYGYGYQSIFVTGSGSDTTPTTVSSINPSNAQTGVPLNARITAVMSDDIDPTTVTNSSITVTPSGGSAVAGTVTLATDGVTLTFVPAAPLAVSQLYNVSVGGFKDVEGNAVTTFTSSFTTGAATYTSFTLVSTSPANGATGVAVTSPVTFNLNNLINPASVNPNTVEVYVNATSQIVAGTYSVSGASVTFTPLSPYPASTLMGMYVYGLTDEAGNAVYCCGWTFTTTNTVDTTPPTVTITPANGTTNAGLNTQVVLTFSKSINPTTINASSVNLLNGDVPLNPATSISRDNRTVVLNYNSGTLPAGATLTVTATSLIKDLSGNPLTNTTSQFTTTAGVSNAAPYVISMRPGSGATQVPTNTVITLFTSARMNSGTLAGALHISQNGVLVSGTTTVGSNGQSVEFTPSSALSAGTTIQVFLDSSAQDIYGNYLSSFSGQFTTAGSPTNTAAVAQAVNPFPYATNVPLNTVIQIEYNQPLLASTINSTNVVLYQYSTNTFLTPTLSLSGGGQVINIAPTSNLVAGSQYFAYVSYGGNVTNTNGINVQAYEVVFTAGTATDTVAPTISSIAPPDTSANIGTNAYVSVNFNKAINPVSVTGSSIKVSGGSVTEVPSSISFTPDYTRTMIIPQAPLPSSTTMAIAISGVTSQAGVSVASKTTHFTTMAGADFSAPYVINPSVQNGQTVGINAAFALQFNKPMDQGSANPAGNQYVFIYDYTSGYVATTITFSADLTTVFLKPTANLTASHQFQMCSYYMTDLSGNPQQNFCVSGFFTGTGTDTTGPVVQQVSPPSGLTGVGINAPVNILFNEPIDGASLAGVTLKLGSTVVPTTTTLYDGDKGIQLRPLVPLATSTVYTINVTGVLDITGNTQSSFASQSFTTGTGTDLVTPTVVSTFPTAGQSNVPDNSTLQAVFSQAMDPASFDANNSFTLRDAGNNVVPATITFSADFKTVSLKPNSNLTGSGATYYFEISYQAQLWDVGGNVLNYGYIQFTTQ
jgi:large repetitive protein